MADVRMPKSKPCQFELAWQGKCNKPSTNGWCTKHEKAKCVSCGKKAVRECDSAGSLVCGANLCKSCQHAEGGAHVKADVAERLDRERRVMEREGTESERMLAERGLSMDPNRPKHLKELLAGKKEGYAIQEVFSLELKHGLMGYFPAIFENPKKRIVLSTDLSLILRIWQALEPRDSQLNVNQAWVNEKLGIGYVIPRDQEEFWLKESKPMRLLTQAEHAELTRDGVQPYRWAPGLLGAGTSERRFRQTIEKAAEERGIALAASAP